MTSTHTAAVAGDEVRGEAGPRARSHAWWAVPLGLYVLVRVVDTVLLVLAAHHAGTDYAGIVRMWDGRWYGEIAEHGYPSTLPRYDASFPARYRGEVAQNPWAFYPLMPGLTRVLMSLAHVPFTLAAPVVTTICGAVASCMLFRLVAQVSTTFAATTTVLALLTFPSAPLLQLGYSEAPTLVLLIGCLMALRARRWALLCLLVLLLAFARPIVLPLAAVMGLLWVLRWRRRGREPFERRDRVGLATAAAVAVLSFGLWPLCAALVTGEPNAYLLTRNAWIIRSDYQSWLGFLFVGDARGLLWMFPAAALAVVLLLPRSKAWGTELKTWAWVYATYLVATTGAGSSGIRYAMLTLVPFWPVPELPGENWSRGRRTAVLVTIGVIGFVMQFFWIRWFLVVGPDLKSFP